MDEGNTSSNKISTENPAVNSGSGQVQDPGRRGDKNRFEDAGASDLSPDEEAEARRSCPQCGLELPFSVRVCPNDNVDLFLSDSQLFADKYELLEEIGQGAIGTIYKARHVALDTMVAIKVLNQVTEDRVTFLRFQREAKTASKITHPNVINVFDFGIWKECQPYMVMDYLEGTTLDRVINSRGRLPLDEVADLIIPVARALAHAHATGVLHRDLKPSNIMILDDAEPGARVKLLDFGLAKLLFRDDGISLSATGAILGSPAYMSPEQASASAVDARTDIYSLGCILYQLLTGDPPLMGNSAAETFMKRLNQDAEPVSTIVSRYIPPRLDLLVSRMVDRDCGRRLKSAAWVHKELLEIKQELLSLPPEKLRPVARPVAKDAESTRRTPVKSIDQEKTVAEFKLNQTQAQGQSRVKEKPGFENRQRNTSTSEKREEFQQSEEYFDRETLPDDQPSKSNQPAVLDFTELPGREQFDLLLELFQKQSFPIRAAVILCAVLILALVVRILIQ